MRPELEDAIKNYDVDTALDEIQAMKVNMTEEAIDLTEAKEVFKEIVCGIPVYDRNLQRVVPTKEQLNIRIRLIKALMEQFPTLDVSAEITAIRQTSLAMTVLEILLKQSNPWLPPFLDEIAALMLPRPGFILPADQAKGFIRITDNVEMAKKALATFEKEQAFVAVLDLARYEANVPARVQFYANLLAHLLKTYPDIDVNRHHEYVARQPSQWNNEGQRLPYDNSEPNNTIPHWDEVADPRLEGTTNPRGVYRKEDWTFRHYKRCTPLMIAVLYKMEPILDVLLAHPTIDVANEQPYAQTSIFDRTIRQKLFDQHVKQFHDSALKAGPDQLRDLYTRHEHAQIGADKVVQYRIDRVDAELKKADYPEAKIELLMSELTQLNAKTALNAYLDIHNKKADLELSLQETLRAVFNERAALVKALAEPTHALARTVPGSSSTSGSAPPRNSWRPNGTK